MDLIDIIEEQERMQEAINEIDAKLLEVQEKKEAAIAEIVRLTALIEERLSGHKLSVAA